MNNPALFNAAYAASLSDSTSRWNTEVAPAPYAGTVAAAVAFATAVDAAIPAAAVTAAMAVVLAQICTGFWAGQKPTDTAVADYSDVAAGIAAMYQEAILSLV